MTLATTLLGGTNCVPPVITLPLSPSVATFPSYIDSSTIPAVCSCNETVPVMTNQVTWINPSSDVVKGFELVAMGAVDASSQEIEEKEKASQQLREMIKTVGELQKVLFATTSLVNAEVEKLGRVHTLLDNMNQTFVQMEKIVSQKDPSEEEMPELIDS